MNRESENFFDREPSQGLRSVETVNRELAGVEEELEQLRVALQAAGVKRTALLEERARMSSHAEPIVEPEHIPTVIEKFELMPGVEIDPMEIPECMRESVDRAKELMKESEAKGIFELLKGLREVIETDTGYKYEDRENQR